MTSDPFRLLCLPGDGIGPEVTQAALAVLEAVAPALDRPIDITHELAGGACYEVHGVFLRNETAQQAHEVDAILFGAEGGVGWDNLDIPGGPTARSSLSRLRKELDLFANIRPVRSWPLAIAQTPFRPEVVAEADLLVVRENTSGIYFGEPRGIFDREGEARAIDTQSYTRAEIDRCAHMAFALADKRKGKVTSADKANVMESGVLWRERLEAVHKEYWAHVTLEHLYADACLFDLVCHPGRFDVIVADNLFGDLISDCAAAISGSLGLLPSASLGPLKADGRRAALFEPVHGSAPDIAGRGIANPIAAILSVAMMLQLSFQRSDLAAKIENSVERVLSGTRITPDLGGDASTLDVADNIVADIDGWMSTL
ncbi:3-isopropylmalate dehydrogenase [Roseibium sp. HPY-6]|uniref:3-isopropylmalate dehydrogenase n=1 Tax=Roseibium sp. HPY-6 TaxID=3229852 RepID=UPI00338F8A26